MLKPAIYSVVLQVPNTHCVYFCFIQTGAAIAEMRVIDSQLLEAAEYGRADDVRSYLAKGANVHVKDFFSVRIAKIIAGFHNLVTYFMIIY